MSVSPLPPCRHPDALMTSAVSRDAGSIKHLGLCECELLRFSCFGSPLLSGHRRYGSRLRTRRLDRVFLGGFLDGGLCALLRKRQELFENLGLCSFVGNFCRSACAA